MNVIRHMNGFMAHMEDQGTSASTELTLAFKHVSVGGSSHLERTVLKGQLIVA